MKCSYNPWHVKVSHFLCLSLLYCVCACCNNCWSERVSYCCLTPIQQFFSYIHGENKLIVINIWNISWNKFIRIEHFKSLEESGQEAIFFLEEQTRENNVFNNSIHGYVTWNRALFKGIVSSYLKHALLY